MKIDFRENFFFFLSWNDRANALFFFFLETMLYDVMRRRRKKRKKRISIDDQK